MYVNNVCKEDITECRKRKQWVLTVIKHIQYIFKEPYFQA